MGPGSRAGIGISEKYDYVDRIEFLYASILVVVDLRAEVCQEDAITLLSYRRDIKTSVCDGLFNLSSPGPARGVPDDFCFNPCYAGSTSGSRIDLDPIESQANTPDRYRLILS